MFLIRSVDPGCCELVGCKALWWERVRVLACRECPTALTLSLFGARRCTCLRMYFLVIRIDFVTTADTPQISKSSSAVAPGLASPWDQLRVHSSKITTEHGFASLGGARSRLNEQGAAPWRSARTNSGSPLFGPDSPLSPKINNCDFRLGTPTAQGPCSLAAPVTVAAHSRCAP